MAGKLHNAVARLPAKCFATSLLTRLALCDPVEGLIRRDVLAEVEVVENLIRKKLPVGTIMSEKRLIDSLAEFVRHHAAQDCLVIALFAHGVGFTQDMRLAAGRTQNHSRYAIEKAIMIMIQKDELASRYQGKSIIRVR